MKKIIVPDHLIKKYRSGSANRIYIKANPIHTLHECKDMDYVSNDNPVKRQHQLVWYVDQSILFTSMMDARELNLSTESYGVPVYLEAEVTSITPKDVRNITDDDASSSGYDGGAFQLLESWVTKYDRGFLKQFNYAADKDYLEEYGFYKRPDERYYSWCLRFKVM